MEIDFNGETITVHHWNLNRELTPEERHAISAEFYSAPMRYQDIPLKE